MMGEPVGRQDRLFYEFDLEDMVPGDHLLRRIDAALDLSWLRWPKCGPITARSAAHRSVPS
jgi:hypothetical protein